MTCKLTCGGAFLHVPKTGGTWVRAALEKNGLASSSIGVEHTPTHYEKWAFCVLRDPVDWWLSLWRFRNDTNFQSMDGQHPLYPLNSWHETDPETFLRRAIDEAPGFCGQLYAQYVRNSNYVLQTEHLACHLTRLGARVGWPMLNLEIPRLNVSATRDLSPAIRPLLGAVRQTEHQAMDLWKNAGGDWSTFDI